MDGTICINQDNLFDNNLKLVVRSILDMEHPTRILLAQRIGISQSAITKIVNRLVNIQLVTETACIETERGRKPIELAINSRLATFIAVRINRSYISAILCAIDGTVFFKVTREISASEGIHPAMETLKDVIRKVLVNKILPLWGIGIALPGPLDVRSERIAMMTGFPGWNDVDLKKELETEFHLPVFLDHDANCGARAETWYGQYKRSKSLVYVLCDRGIGVGFVLGNDIYSNPRGFTGEFGHMSINCFGPRCECGNHGCLELYASTVALEREYQKEVFETGGSQFPPLDAPAICALVRGGDTVARRAFARTCTYLAFGTVSLINLLCPEIVVFDDRITEGGPYFLEVVNETLKRHLLPGVFNNLQTSVSTLKDDAVLLGAGALAFEQLLVYPEHINQEK
jgi:N-acetylglucosamine repressor